MGAAVTATELARQAQAHVAAGRTTQAEALWWQMAQGVYGLIVPIARRYAVGAAMDDLLQEGLIGAYVAATKYDPARGTQFSTMARWWARAYIHRANERDTGVTISSWGNETLRRADCVIAEHEAAGRTPTAEQLLDELRGTKGVSAAVLHDAMAARRGVLSSDAPVGPYDELRLGDTLTAGEADPALGVEVDRALAEMPQREAEALIRWVVHGETMEAIGAEFGCGRERVRQLIRTGIARATGQALPKSAARRVAA